jgi:hypothetical protein
MRRVTLGSGNDLSASVSPSIIMPMRIIISRSSKRPLACCSIKNLEPLAVSVGRERGIADLAKASKSQRQAIVYAMKTRDWDRAMLVEVTGGGGLANPGPDANYHKNVKPVGERAGFALFARGNAPSRTEDPPELEGYSASEPFVWVRCPGGNRNCSFDVAYKRSRVNFNLPRSEFERAVPVAKHLLQLLKSHDVTTGAGRP